MKVCDKHPEKAAVDTLHIQQDDTFIDVCDECKFSVMSYLTGNKELEPKDLKSFVQKVLGK